MDLFNLILIFFLIGFGFTFYNFFLSVSNRYNLNFLIDDQFRKPQAFHKFPTPMIGGIGIFISLLIIFCVLFFLKDIVLFEYIYISILFFILGFIDDLKININPNIRLILMIVLLIFFVQYNNFYIEATGIEFLNNWLSDSKYFSLIFVCLCFLFIINGANLIDGYNGLLGIHSLIIFINLFLINYFNENSNLVNLLFFTILILLIFLKFNFPKGKIFLGDGGSYLLGALLAATAISTSIANPTISPFYFCILLFYLFFEVFFSFFRKLIKEKISPVHPDKKHLHMLIYKTLLKKNNDKLKSNFYVSVIINFGYLVLLVPATLMMKDGMFCKYYSIVFFIVYIFSYGIVYKNIE